jgi:hypothetical protein
MHFHYKKLLEMLELLELRGLFDGGSYMRKYGILFGFGHKMNDPKKAYLHTHQQPQELL